MAYGGLKNNNCFCAAQGRPQDESQFVQIDGQRRVFSRFGRIRVRYVGSSTSFKNEPLVQNATGRDGFKSKVATTDTAFGSSSDLIEDVLASRTQRISSKLLIFLAVTDVSVSFCSWSFHPIHCDIIAGFPKENAQRSG